MVNSIAILLARVREQDSKYELQKEKTAGQNIYLLNVL